MEIFVAKTAGFCFGVDKAVNLTYNLIDNTSEPIYTMGQIIHNDHVVKRLESKGVKVIKEIDEINDPKCNLVIRAHGVTRKLYEEIMSKNLSLTDATCPFVKKIHKLVSEKFEEGYQIVIVGDKEHPEVIGINGWCNDSAYIINQAEDVDKVPQTDKKICVVAQTTITNEKWEKVNTELKQRFKDVTSYDTICTATSQRQKEAEEISQKVDLMIVIGGENSSNTQKLYEICIRNCPQTYKIETSGELPPVDIKKIKKIGITAGASTPDWIIKEVLEKMSELNKLENEMSFQEAYESSLVTLNTGDKVKGKIVGYNNAEVYVDLGFKSDGIIPMEQFTDDENFNPEKALKAGEDIEAIVVRVNDGEGTVLLSKKRVDAMRGWTKIEEAFESKAPIQAKVQEVVNGGVIANANGIRIFIPASQVSDRFVKDLKEFVNQTLEVRIVEYNKPKKKIVGSHRVIVEEQKAALSGEFWNNVEIGKLYEGVVKSIMDFGAFVDIGGVDGLVHISELSWTKVKHPSDVLKVGEKIQVKILEFDKEKGRISLGYRKTEDNPWYNAGEKYKVGETVKVKVVRFVPFGAFVELEEGIDGLVHISQISNMRIAKPGDVLEIGQEVEAKITEVNLETKKIGLSIKEVNPMDPVGAKKEENTESNSGEVLPTEHTEEMEITIGDVVKTENENA